MLGFWLLVAPASVRGQDSSLLWPSPGPRAVTASQFAMRHAARAEVPLGTERTAPRAAARRSYWLEGAIAGGVVFGVAGGVVAGGICGADDRAGGAAFGGCTGDVIGGGLIGAALGGVIGGLIGSRIHKGPAREAAPQ